MLYFYNFQNYRGDIHFYSYYNSNNWQSIMNTWHPYKVYSSYKFFLYWKLWFFSVHNLMHINYKIRHMFYIDFLTLLAVSIWTWRACIILIQTCRVCAFLTITIVYIALYTIRFLTSLTLICLSIYSPSTLAFIQPAHKFRI